MEPLLSRCHIYGPSFYWIIKNDLKKEKFFLIKKNLKSVVTVHTRPCDTLRNCSKLAFQRENGGFLAEKGKLEKQLKIHHNVQYVPFCDAQYSCITHLNVVINVDQFSTFQSQFCNECTYSAEPSPQVWLGNY